MGLVSEEGGEELREEMEGAQMGTFSIRGGGWGELRQLGPERGWEAQLGGISGGGES